MKDSFNFDVDEITGRVIMLLAAKGWTVYDWEAVKLKETIQKVKEEIYS
jgi:hypothetical protein